MAIKKHLNIRGDNGWNESDISLNANDRLTIIPASRGLTNNLSNPPPIFNGTTIATNDNNSEWDTGINIVSGQTLTINAKGKWHTVPAWEHTFDFSIDDREWTLEPDFKGSYVQGAYWQVKESNASKPGISIAYDLPKQLDLASVKMYINTKCGNLSSVERHLIVGWTLNGIFDRAIVSKRCPSGDGSFVITANDITADKVHARGAVGAAGNGAHVRITKVILAGLGVNPFMTSQEEVTFGPEGDTSADTTNFLHPSAPAYSLIGKIGENGDWFEVGKHKIYTVPGGVSGNLYLAMNDKDHANNSGGLSYQVQINGGNNPPDCSDDPQTEEERFDLVGRIGGGASFEIGEYYDKPVTIGGTLELSTKGCVNKNVSALILVNAPDACDNDSSCEAGGYYNKVASQNPIQLRTANKIMSETDLTVNSPTGKLTFTRSFRQDRLSDSDYQFMGLGWSHNHRYTLHFSGISPNREAVVNLPDGGYIKLDEDGVGGHFDARAGASAVLDHDGTNNQYVLTTSGKATFVFSDVSPHLLEKRTFPNGEELTYTYSGNDLSKVEDGYGREINLSYYSTVDYKDGKLWRVGDHTATGLNTGSPGGRYIELDYTSEKSNGTVVTSPKALLETIKDVRGNTWTYDYYGQDSGESDAHQLNFMLKRQSPSVDTDGDGTADGVLTLEDLTYTLDGSGNITQIDQERGAGLIDTQFRFQPNGNNITEAETAGQIVTHHFANGVYVGQADANGNLPWQALEDNYRPQGTSDANGNQTDLTWSTDGKHLEAVSDAAGNNTSFNYDTQDRLTDTTDAQGRKTEYTYGDANNPRQPTVIKVFDTDGTTVLRHQEFVYDGKGRTTEEKTIDPDDGTTVLRQTTRVYGTSGNGNGLLESITQVDIDNASNNTTTTYTYDSAGRVIKTQKTSLFGTCEFSYTVYDPAGNVLATVCSGKSLTIPTTVAEAEAMYDASHAEKKHNRVTVHTYDAMGRRVKTTTNAGMTNEQTSVTLYDALSRVVRTISNYVPQGSSAPGDWVWDETDNRWEDGAGNPINHGTGVNNDQNIISDTDYNARGMVRMQRDPLGNVTLFGYNDAGRLVKTIQNASQSSYNNDYTGTTPDSDLSDYVTSSNPDEDIVTEQVYDPAGNLVTSIDPAGRKSFTVYDALNRPIKTVRNAKDDATIALSEGDAGYNAVNDPRSDNYAPSTAPDRDMIDTTDYDAMGRVIRSQRLLENRNGIAVWDTTLFGYDAQGRQIKVVRHAATSSYDLIGDPDLTGYDANVSSQPDEDIITETTYDAQGRVAYPIDVNDSKNYMVYDGLGRQIMTVGNYQNGTPETWLWDTGDDRWEDGSNAPITFGDDNDENIISQTHYDSDGRVQWTRDVLGRRTYNVYDAQGRQVRTIRNYVKQGGTDPADWVWNTTNDRWEQGASDSTAIVHGTNDDLNQITETVYNDLGQVQQTLDVRRNVTYNVYNAIGRRVMTIGNYVPQGTSDPADWVWANNQWEDGNNNPIQFGADFTQNRITHTTYDRVGRVVETRNPAGIVTHNTYDDLGRRVETVQNYVDGIFDTLSPDEDLMSQTVYNQAGQVVKMVDARGTETSFTYDHAGRRVMVTQASNTSLAVSSYTCYDKAGRVLRTIQGYVPLYDENDHLISPDAWNAGTWVFDPTVHGYNADQNRITKYTYDKASRRTVVTDPLGNQTTTIYFKDGQVESVTDPEGTVTQYRYDGLRRRNLVVQGFVDNGTDPAEWVWNSNQYEDGNSTAIVHGTNNDQNIIVQVAHDLVGRMTSLRDPRGNLTSYEYDQLNRRTSLTNPMSNSWTTAYANLTGGGSRQTMTYPGVNGTGSYDVVRDFDPLGRLKSISFNDPTTTPDVDFGYDILGNRTHMTEYDDALHTSIVRQTTFTYDDVRRLTDVDFDTDGDGTVEETVNYEYDARGLRTKMTLPGNLDITYNYDERGQLISVTDWDTQTTNYAYDNAGRHIATTRPNGFRSRYRYDLASRLTRLRHTAGEQTYGDFIYTVDKRGNRTRVLEALPHPNGTTTTIAYNDAGIVTNGVWADVSGYKQSAAVAATLKFLFFGDENVTLTMGEGNDHGRYDVYVGGSLWESFEGYAASNGDRTITIPLNRDGPHLLELRVRSDRDKRSSGNKVRFKQLVVDGEYDLRQIDYTYDALSRLIEADYDDGGTHSYGYDPAGNMVNMDGVMRTFNDANQMTHDGTSALSYDANGNLLTGGYVWDRANRLASFGGITYAYDGLNNRVSQNDGVNVTHYLLDLGRGLTQVVAETTGTDVTRYVHDPRGLLATQQNGSTWTWGVLDALGSQRAQVSGGLVAARHFSEYGMVQGQHGTFSNPMAFTGEPLDANGLQYHRARYYAPTLGIFPSLDPFEGMMGRPMSLNGYSWVEGNPVMNVDPSGNQCYAPSEAGINECNVGGASGGAIITRGMFRTHGPQSPAGGPIYNPVRIPQTHQVFFPQQYFPWINFGDQTDLRERANAMNNICTANYVLAELALALDNASNIWNTEAWPDSGAETDEDRNRDTDNEYPRHLAFGFQDDNGGRELLQPFTNLLNSGPYRGSMRYPTVLNDNMWANWQYFRRGREERLSDTYFFPASFYQAISDTRVVGIHFNLESILDDANSYRDFALYQGNKGTTYHQPGSTITVEGRQVIFSATAWELYYISSSPALCNITQFYEHGSTDVTPSDTLKSLICSMLE